MNLSIVATLYHSEKTLETFVDRVRKAAVDFGGTFEIILVNDGSPDNSLPMAKKMAESSDDVVVVDLSRNFGHHRAMLTGLRYARGDRVFLIDSDLEEDPAWLKRFADKQAETGADLVFGVQNQRKGGWFEKVSGDLFYRIFDRLIRLKIPRDAVTARFMTKRFVDALRAYDEQIVFLSGVMAHAGFEHAVVHVDKGSKGSTTYKLRRKVSLAVDAITSFSSAPMRYVFYAGMLILAAAIGVSAFAVFGWIFFEKPPGGWTSLIISIWLLGGMMLSAIGVVGLYLGRIFDEIKARPRVVIREVVGRPHKE